MERCKHGLLTPMCAFCNPPPEDPSKKRRPRHNDETSPFGEKAVDAEALTRDGIAVIHTKEGRNSRSLGYLGPETKMVHIDGHPFLWAIAEILKRAPNLKVFQVIPTMLGRIHQDSGMMMLRERGVQVVGGHVRPDMAWAGEENRSPTYDPQREFLMSLQGEQKKLFDELVLMGFEAVSIALRYFCLNEEEFVPQRIICEQFGYGKGNMHYISAKIAAILYYLDQAFPANETAVRLARVLRNRVEKLRPYVASMEARRQAAVELGLEKLPDNFPMARFHMLKKLLSIRYTDLSALAELNERYWKAITLRFGLDTQSVFMYRSLEEVGFLMGGITRERVRQLEEKALEILGIEEE